MHYKERRMLLEKTLAIAKLTAISMAIVVAILCLGYSNAYGLSAPQMQLTKPGGQAQLSQGHAGTIVNTQFDVNDETNCDFNGDDGTTGGGATCPTVPEPMSIILLGVGLAGIKLLKRRD
jgi:hypothetical protein